MKQLAAQRRESMREKRDPIFLRILWFQLVYMYQPILIQSQNPLHPLLGEYQGALV